MFHETVNSPAREHHTGIMDRHSIFYIMYNDLLLLLEYLLGVSDYMVPEGLLQKVHNTQATSTVIEENLLQMMEDLTDGAS